MNGFSESTSWVSPTVNVVLGGEASSAAAPLARVAAPNPVTATRAAKVAATSVFFIGFPPHDGVEALASGHE